jgi:hypothetical protein
MKLANAYSTVIRYGRLLPNSDIIHFIDAHHAGDSAALPALTDKFLEVEDPRGDILQRHLGLTKHPVDKPEEAFPYTFDPNPFTSRWNFKYQLGNEEEPQGISTLFLEGRTDVPGAKLKAFRLHFSHRKRPPVEQGRSDFDWLHAGGFFTSEEAHQIADKFPSPSSDQIHELINKITSEK